MPDSMPAEVTATPAGRAISVKRTIPSGPAGPSLRYSRWKPGRGSPAGPWLATNRSGSPSPSTSAAAAPWPRCTRATPAARATSVNVPSPSLRYRRSGAPPLVTMNRSWSPSPSKSSTAPPPDMAVRLQDSGACRCTSPVASGHRPRSRGQVANGGGSAATDVATTSSASAAPVARRLTLRVRFAPLTAGSGCVGPAWPTAGRISGCRRPSGRPGSSPPSRPGTCPA